MHGAQCLSPTFGLLRSYQLPTERHTLRPILPNAKAGKTNFAFCKAPLAYSPVAAGCAPRSGQSHDQNRSELESLDFAALFFDSDPELELESLEPFKLDAAETCLLLLRLDDLDLESPDPFEVDTAELFLPFGVAGAAALSPSV